jgi:8-oxo-dGTP pyrophosphatase MutT (NUDIX family)
MSEPRSPAHPAATVVLLRDGENGSEVLLLRRNERLAFHGGAWVFPGGRLDRADYEAAGSDDVVAVARHAAVREAREEAGLSVSPGCLVLLSRWITPDILPKRFDTWFFAARIDDDAVHIDGEEIHDHLWISPDEALATRARGEIELPPPTFVTLLGLAGSRSAAETLASLSLREAETFAPRICMVSGGACSLYAGDAGYDDGAVDREGPRHRLWMLGSSWRYERSL